MDWARALWADSPTGEQSVWFKWDSGVHLKVTVPRIPVGFLEGDCRLPSPSGEGLGAEAPGVCRVFPAGGPTPAFRGQFPRCTGLELQANCELGTQLRPAELAPGCRLFPTDMYINSWHLLNQI